MSTPAKLVMYSALTVPAKRGMRLPTVTVNNKAKYIVALRPLIRIKYDL